MSTAESVSVCRQSSLFNVLKVYAITDPQVGYCAGMANIVAVLLLYMEEEVCLSIALHNFLCFPAKKINSPAKTVQCV